MFFSLVTMDKHADFLFIMSPFAMFERIGSLRNGRIFFIGKKQYLTTLNSNGMNKDEIRKEGVFHAANDFYKSGMS